MPGNRYALLSLLLLSAPAIGNNLPIQQRPTLLEAGKSKGDPVDIEKLPKAVAEAAGKAFPNAKLTKAFKQSDGNYFLTDIKVGKKEYNMTISPDGKVLKQEQDND